MAARDAFRVPAVVARDDSRDELFLGGMLLVANRGDVDIYPRDGESIRIQRADLDEIIAFLQKARKDRV